MRTRIQFGIALLLLVMLSGAGSCASDQESEPSKFFREYIGLKDDEIAAIRRGKAIAKILESRTPDEVFVFGSVYVEVTPESYFKLVSDIDALQTLSLAPVARRVISSHPSFRPPNLQGSFCPPTRRSRRPRRKINSI